MIPRVFPTFSSNVKGPNFPLCKYQLMKYKPWRTNQNNAWGDQEGSGQVFVSKWKEFLESPAAKQHATSFPGFSPSRPTVGRVGENPGNEVEQHVPDNCTSTRLV